MTLSFQNEILLNYTESGGSPTPPPTPTYTYNVEAVGDNVVFDGKYGKILNIIDGHSRTSYIKTKTAIADELTQADSWKISLTYQELGYGMENYLTVLSTGAPSIDTNDYQIFASGFEAGSLNLFMSTGSGWDLAQFVSAPSSLYATSPSWFVYELEFTGTQYVWRMKNLTTGDTTFTTCWSANSTSKVAKTTATSTPYYLILGNQQFGYPNYGNFIEIDLSESYYTIDGTTTYLAIAQ